MDAMVEIKQAISSEVDSGETGETLGTEHRDNIQICLSRCTPFPLLKTAFWHTIILNNRPRPMEDATRYHGNDYDGFVVRQSR